MTADLADVVTAFGGLLHAAGVPQPLGSTGRFASAVAAAAPATVDELYWLGRVTLLADVGQVATYDAVFGQVFRGWADVVDSRGDTSQLDVGRRRPAQREAQRSDGARTGGSAGHGQGGEGEASQDVVLGAVGGDERLGGKDFAALTPEELATLRSLIAELRLAPPRRPSRRRARHRTGDELDVRAMMRAAGRTNGDPVSPVLRRRRTRPRRVVLLADVSGSMEAYSRAYLHLLHGAVRGARAEAFVFSTRLTRLTRALTTHDPDLALTRAATAAPDWAGGTRIGHALKTFTDEHGRRGMARGAVVVIVSDGWEHDDPALLAEQLDRLSRLAARIVWVNPRKANPRYEPLTGGMSAALPYVDAFVSGHSLDALDEVVAAIRGYGGRTRASAA
jgi:uncharacterized protein with von Willebrand factor type A (vWA) domain